MSPDFLDLLRALLAADARFMIVDAYAVGVHGRPRATKDLDVWVEASAINAPKVMAALREFGAPLMGLTVDDMREPGVGLQIGVEPGRIDLLTAISGVRFDEFRLTSVQEYAVTSSASASCFKTNGLPGDLRTLRTSRRCSAFSASSPVDGRSRADTRGKALRSRRVDQPMNP